MWKEDRNWHRESWSRSKIWNVSLSKLHVRDENMFLSIGLYTECCPLQNSVRQSKIWCFPTEKNTMHSPWPELISHGQLRSLRFSVGASYFSQRRSIRSWIFVRHFREDRILYWTRCLKYIFIVHVKFAKRNISNFWPWPWLTTSTPNSDSRGCRR